MLSLIHDPIDFLVDDVVTKTLPDRMNFHGIGERPSHIPLFAVHAIKLVQNHSDNFERELVDMRHVAQIVGIGIRVVKSRDDD